MDTEDLEIVRDAIIEGDSEMASALVGDLIERLEDVDIPSDYNLPTPSISSSSKGDIAAAIITIGAVGGFIFFAIRAAIKEDKRIQAERDKERKRMADEEERAQNAASRGATILPRPGGGYWIVENDRSLDVLAKFEDDTKKESRFVDNGVAVPTPITDIKSTTES